MTDPAKYRPDRCGQPYGCYYKLNLGMRLSDTTNTVREIDAMGPLLQWSGSHCKLRGYSTPPMASERSTRWVNRCFSPLVGPVAIKAPIPPTFQPDPPCLPFDETQTTLSFPTPQFPPRKNLAKSPPDLPSLERRHQNATLQQKFAKSMLHINSSSPPPSRLTVPTSNRSHPIPSESSRKSDDSTSIS